MAKRKKGAGLIGLLNKDPKGIKQVSTPSLTAISGRGMTGTNLGIRRELERRATDAAGMAAYPSKRKKPKYR